MGQGESWVDGRFRWNEPAPSFLSGRRRSVVAVGFVQKLVHLL
jgi:hypothetical protein